MKISVPGTDEAVFMHPGDPSRGCEVHDWATDGLAKRLIAAMRERHGKGGINACRECVGRAKADADAKRGRIA